MIKVAFQLYSVLAILSPWAFLIARAMGLYNFPYDCLVFVGLFTLSAVVMFLTFGRWGD